MPLAAHIVSSMLSASSRIVSSIAATRLPFARRDGSPYFRTASFILLASECRKISYAGQFERVHYFDDCSERRLLVSLQGEGRFLSGREVPDRTFEVVRINGVAIQFDVTGFVYRNDGVFQFSRCFRCRF